MIVFDLKCDGGHVFEAWFGSSADYESQRERRLIHCAICGDGGIGKALMAPAIPAKGNRTRGETPRPVATSDDPAAKVILAAMAKMQAVIEERCDYVGESFADEARAMHLGEIPHRGIYGEATAAQAGELRDEGIEVAALPFRSRRSSDA